MLFKLFVRLTSISSKAVSEKSADSSSIVSVLDVLFLPRWLKIARSTSWGSLTLFLLSGIKLVLSKLLGEVGEWFFRSSNKLDNPSRPWVTSPRCSTCFAEFWRTGKTVFPPIFAVPSPSSSSSDSISARRLRVESEGAVAD